MPIYLTITIPKELKNAFKAKCAERGLSMREVLIKLIKEWING